MSPPSQRHGRPRRHGRAGDVPGVDDDTTRFVSGVVDEPQAVVQRLDVRPGEELDPQPRADVVRLGRELGELRGPAPAVPWAVVAVGGDLDVPGAERLRRLEQAVPDPIGLLSPGPVVPPVRDALELEVDDAVVGEHGPDSGQPVFRHGGGQVVGQQAEAPEAGRRRGLDPFAQRQRAAQVRSVGGSVTRGGPTGGEQLVRLRSSRSLVAASSCHPRYQRCPAVAGGLCTSRLRVIVGTAAVGSPALGCIPCLVARVDQAHRR